MTIRPFAAISLLIRSSKAYTHTPSASSAHLKRVGAMTEKDPESNSVTGKGPGSVPHLRLVFDQGLVTPEVLKWYYDAAFILNLTCA